MLWIVGTSVSIESGGYATRLSSRLADEQGIACSNLSVGDQTSLMGCMRVLNTRAQIAPGDVVIWEYSLLDALLVPDGFPRDDVEQARRVAWHTILKCKAWLIVVMTPPKRFLTRRCDIETRTASDAKAMDIPCIDGRDIFAALGLAHAAAHYRDDRHPYIDSPFVDAMVGRLYAEVTTRHGRESTQTYSPASASKRPWRWMDAVELADAAGANVAEFRNTLMTIKALCLSCGASMVIPDIGRIVAVGIVSQHDSGGLWCEHSDCSPVSTRLPSELDYSFLLRSTELACRRAGVTTLTAAPRWAYQDGVWAAYGQEPSLSPGPVAVLGILYESGEESTQPRAAYLRWTPRAPVARGWHRMRRAITRLIVKARRMF